MQWNIDQTIPGWTRMEKLECLAQYASKVPHNGWIIDVGTFLGRSAFALAANCHSDVMVTCIDTWDKGPTEVLVSSITNLLGMTDDKYFTMEQCYKELRNVANTELYQAKSPCVHPRLKHERPDLIFLDADQTEEPFIDDLTFWFNMLEHNGTLIIDDYNHPLYPWIPDIVDTFARNNANRFEIIEETKTCKSQFAIITKG